MSNQKTAALLLALTLLLLTACAGSGGSADPTAAPTAAPAAPVTQDPTASPAATAEPAPAASEAEAGVCVEIQSKREYRYADDTDVLLLTFRADVPTVVAGLSDAARESINRALAEDAALFTDGSDQTEGISGLEGYLAAAREDYAWQTESGWGEGFDPYFLERTVEVTRADSGIVSLLYTEDTYSGGAHGYRGRYGRTFDAATGEPLTLADLAEDSDAFLADCADCLWELSRDGEHAAYAPDGYFPGYEEYLPGLLRDGNWFFAENGLVVIANTYELAPYAAGCITFTLPYTWLGRYLKAEYMPPEKTADGELLGEITAEPGDCTYLTDDNTDGQGACVRLTAVGAVRDLTVSRIEFYGDYKPYTETGDVFFAGCLNDGETLVLRTWIPDVLPALKLRYAAADGVREYLISQSGRDGSLVLMDARPFMALPLEISGRLPFVFDVDGDNENEVIDLVNNGDGRWSLTVDGVSVGDVYALDAEVCCLWLADLDWDGVTELIFSGDMGSDDYVTCVWRGDTLESVSLTGFSFRGGDGPAADGRAVFSAGRLFLEGYVSQLGTYRSVIPCELRDGVIVPEEGSHWEYTSNRTVLTVKHYLPALMDDAGEITLAPGTELLLLGTDGETVYFSADGRTGTLRAEPSEDAGGWLIGGVAESEAFETLPYAG